MSELKMSDQLKPVKVNEIPLNNNQYLLFQYMKKIESTDQDAEDISDARKFYQLYFQVQNKEPLLYYKNLTDNDYLIFRYILKINLREYSPSDVIKATEFYNKYFNERNVPLYNRRDIALKEILSLPFIDVVKNIITHVEHFGQSKRRNKSSKRSAKKSNKKSTKRSNKKSTKKSNKKHKRRNKRSNK